MGRFISYASTVSMLLAAGCGGFTTLGDGAGAGGTVNAAGTGMGNNGGDATTGGTTGMTGGMSGSSAKGGSGGTGATGGTIGMTGGTGATGGTGMAGSGGGGGYAPCANKACGATCTLCDPTDPSCVEDQIVKYCDTSGDCGVNFPVCGMTECTTAMDCVTPAFCELCSDGSSACPTSDCVSGKCVTSFPTCPTPACMSDADCPVSVAPCQACPDGSTACPWAHCIAGQCASGIDACDNTDPCQGKSCGDACSTCPAGGVCNNLAQYCDENLNCQVNQPMCTAPQCKQDSDCVTDVCGQCAGSSNCASQVCVDDKCQFSCPTPPMDPCGGCPTGEMCVDQVGGPASSTTATDHCAKAPPCPVPSDGSQCLCVQGEGTCKPAIDSGNTCLCDNGIR
jgi:hypothetical protein